MSAQIGVWFFKIRFIISYGINIINKWIAIQNYMMITKWLCYARWTENNVLIFNDSWEEYNYNTQQSRLCMNVLGEFWLWPNWFGKKMLRFMIWERAFQGKLSHSPGRQTFMMVILFHSIKYFLIYNLLCK